MQNNASVEATCLHGKTPLHYAAKAYEVIYELHKIICPTCILQRRLPRTNYSSVVSLSSLARMCEWKHNIGKLLIDKYHQYFDDLDFSIVNLLVYPNIGQILLEKFLSAQKYRRAMIFFNDDFVDDMMK